MKTAAAIAFAVLVSLGSAGPAAGQTSERWVSAWGGLFLDPGTVVDPETGTRWDFGTGFAAGASVQQRLGRSLLVGVDVGYAPLRHEVQAVETGTRLADGRAHLLTTMVTGRLGAGGGDFSTYLTGGVGAVTYGIPHLDRWDPDFAFRGGGGLEYSQSPNLALFLEWNRWWVLHQTEGVGDNTVKHSSVELGVRYGL